eukprot:CAMPEP_0171977718 /NCGR_PEP_ID=MMETSP0993-20121228/248668_1 /TAXON_ID=483369 /ORGANISM="non described non described, Strain CCMP2098" /LENGTH=41 /DNA_ID= /DNA_START= /DNA_END= /DNA_ORIENTATION=
MTAIGSTAAAAASKKGWLLTGLQLLLWTRVERSPPPQTASP